MIRSLTPQKVIFFLLTLGGFLLAPLLTTQVLDGDFMPSLAVLGFFLTLLLVRMLGENIWILIPAFLTIQGRLNFLPASLTMMETAILASFLFLMFTIIFQKNRQIKMGPLWFYLPIFVLASILLFHWIASRDIGLKLFGGANFGGRKYWAIFLGFLSAPLLFSLIRPRDPAMRWIPLLFLVAASFDFGFFLISSFAPSLAPLIFKVYSNVNMETFSETLNGATGERGIIRVGDLGFFCSSAQVVIFSYFPAWMWLRPGKWWCWPASAICLLGCIYSGFRTYLFRFIISVTSSLYVSARRFLPIFGLIGLIGVFLLVVSQGRLLNLPIVMQRTLSFLPGLWTSEAKTSTEGSNKFRQNIKQVYWNEFAPKGMWFGQGMTYDKEWAFSAVDEIYLRSVAHIQYNEDYDNLQTARAFISRRQTHEGLEDIHLPTGWIGTAALIGLFLSTSFWALVKVSKINPKEVLPIQIWGISLLMVEILSYFTVYGDMSMTLPRICVLFPILYRSFEISPVEPPSSPLARVG